MNTGPKQHLRMKYSLAAFAMREEDEFMKLFSTNSTALLQVWEHSAQSYPVEDRVPSMGAGNGTLDLPGYEAVVLIMPPPRQRNEAYYMLVLRPPGGRCRIFALESALNPTTKEPYTVIAEFHPTGRANWGEGGDLPEPHPGDFTRRVLAIVKDPEAMPNAFTELPIIQM
jgi:hypothetical protein